MFTGCYKLRHLPDGFRIPDHVKYLDGMFWNCIGLKYVPDLPGDAASAEWMFAGCALENLPDDFQLPKGIKNVNGLFIGNDLLKKLPNTFTIPDGVEDAAEMFSGCDSLTKLPKGFHIPAKKAIFPSSMAFTALSLENSSVNEPHTNGVNTSVSSPAVRKASAT